MTPPKVPLPDAPQASISIEEANSVMVVVYEYPNWLELFVMVNNETRFTIGRIPKSELDVRRLRPSKQMVYFATRPTPAPADKPDAVPPSPADTSPSGVA